MPHKHLEDKNHRRKLKKDINTNSNSGGVAYRCPQKCSLREAVEMDSSNDVLN